jgi:hypothetical protein
MSLANEGDSASLGVAITSGTINSQQGIQTGSVYNDMSATCTAPWAQIKQQTSFQGIKDSTTTIFDNSISKALVFNINANSNTVGTTGYIISSGNLKDGKKVTGCDGQSNGEVSTEVENADWFKYRFTNPANWIGLDLSVENADSISAKAFVTSGLGDSVPLSIKITKNWLFGTKGSLKDYLSEVSFKDSKATATQSFSRAEGDNILLNSVPNPDQDLLWDLGGDSYGKITNGKVEGYKGSANIDMTGGIVRGTISQGINYATGHNIEVGAYAYDNVGKDSANVVTKVTSGSISSYFDEATAEKGKTTATIGKPSIVDAKYNVGINAKGSEVYVRSHAENEDISRQQYLGVDIFPKGGSADLVVMKRNDDALNNAVVDTSATSNDVNIHSDTGTKTALILDPFLKSFRAADMASTSSLDPFNYFNSVSKPLLDKGYEVTYYANAGVSLDKIRELDEPSISIFRTHGVTDDPTQTGLMFSKVSEINSDNNPKKGFDYINPSDLKFTNKNDMIILDGCESFKIADPQTGIPKWAETFKNAKVSGGFKKDAFPLVDTPFMSKFIERLCVGDTPDAANEAAYKYVLDWNLDPLVPILAQKLVLIGSKDTPHLPVWTEV